MTIYKIKKKRKKNENRRSGTFAGNKCLKTRKKKEMSLEEIFNNFYYKILYSYPFIGDYYINTML